MGKLAGESGGREEAGPAGLGIALGEAANHLLTGGLAMVGATWIFLLAAWVIATVLGVHGRAAGLPMFMVSFLGFPLGAVLGVLALLADACGYLAWRRAGGVSGYREATGRGAGARSMAAYPVLVLGLFLGIPLLALAAVGC